MPAKGQSFYIAGAGIAGLTLALALARFGAHVVVLEKNPTISEFGAGLQISPNARKVLNQLGLDDALQHAGLEPAGIDIYPYKRPKPLVTLELGALIPQTFGAPYTVMHRADLADVLYAAARRFANIDVIFGVNSVSVDNTVNGVAVTWKTDSAAPRTGRGKAFIGADGVHSPTRIQQLQGVSAKYHGRYAWRTLLPFSAAEGVIALDKVSVLFGPGYHMVCYPLPHRQQVNIALFNPAPQNLAADTSNPTLPPIKSAAISKLCAAAQDQWTPWPLYTVETNIWHKANVGLIGDAAHAMVPFQAQGAAMAIEDAAVLAPLLVSQADPDSAFAQYEASRQPRVARVARTSLSNGTIFHMPWPLSVARNTVIALQGQRGHLRRLGWLYSYET
jgi:salicylate hydroxylase